MQRDRAQTVELIEDFARELWIELFSLRDICLHRRDVQGGPWGRILDPVNAKGKKTDDREHGEGEIKMGAHLTGASFEKQTNCSGDGDEIGERNRER